LASLPPTPPSVIPTNEEPLIILMASLVTTHVLSGLDDSELAQNTEPTLGVMKKDFLVAISSFLQVFLILDYLSYSKFISYQYF
jgi:hypothetical protein